MERKNVILIVADAMRADRLSCNGYHRNGKKLTPNLDKLAKDGILYKKAYAPGSWTRPSQPATMTGMWASNIGYPGRDKELDKDITTLGEEFHNRGYETRAYNMAPFLRADQGFAKGFDYYEDVFLNDKFRLDFDHLESIAWNLVNGNDNWTRYMSKKIRKWIKKRNSENPFFLFWNPVNPHNKYKSPREFREKFERPVKDRMNKEGIEEIADWATSHEYTANTLELTDDEMDVVESRYDAEIAYLDYRIGELIDFLKKEGLYDDTIIAFTSDHGENFGEHGLIYHGIYLNEALIRVPLIIKNAQDLDKSLSNKPVSTLDLFNSLLKLSGNEEAENKDSRPSLVENSEKRKIVFSEVEDEDPDELNKLKKGSPEKPFSWYQMGAKVGVKEDKKLVRFQDGSQEEFLIDGFKEEKTSLEKKTKNEILSALQELGPYTKEKNRVKDEEIKNKLEKLGYT